jgi:hypothetical protein
MFAVLSVLLVAVCLAPAVGKLAAHPKMVAAAGHFGIPWPRYRLIGIAELAAAMGVLAGLIWPPIGVAAALGMCVLLAGALVTHHRSGDAFSLALPAAIGLAVGVAYLAVALGQ